MTPKKDPTLRILPPTRTNRVERPRMTDFKTQNQIESDRQFARRHAPKPSSWWTRHASETPRSEFAAEVIQRDADRCARLGRTS